MIVINGVSVLLSIYLYFLLTLDPVCEELLRSSLVLDGPFRL